MGKDRRRKKNKRFQQKRILPLVHSDLVLVNEGNSFQKAAH